jgi:hypothetical protein
MTHTTHTTYNVNPKIGSTYLDDIINTVFEDAHLHESTFGEYIDEDALYGEVESVESTLTFLGIPYSRHRSDNDERCLVDGNGNVVNEQEGDGALYTKQDMMAIGYAAAGYDGDLFTDELYERAKQILKDELKITNNNLVSAAFLLFGKMSVELYRVKAITNKIESDDGFIPLETVAQTIIKNSIEDKAIGSLTDKQKNDIAKMVFTQVDLDMMIETPDGELLLGDAINHYMPDIDMDSDDDSTRHKM